MLLGRISATAAHPRPSMTPFRATLCSALLAGTFACGGAHAAEPDPVETGSRHAAATDAVVEKAAAGHWRSDYEAAAAEAKAAGLPLVVHFYADWCGPCRMMKAGVLHTPEVLSALADEDGERVIAVEINSDHRRDLTDRFGIAALPSDVVLGPDGEEVSRSVGPADTAEYVGRLASAAGFGSPDTADAAAAERTADLLEEWAATRGLGLEGYSPVALTGGRLWKKGSPAFAWRHEGITYHLCDADELARFRLEPEKYAPQLSGFDPYRLAGDRVAAPGAIRYGSFYEGKLYLHTDAASRAAFMKHPDVELPNQVFPSSSLAVSESGDEMMGS